MQNNNRQAYFDGLRFFAILSIMLFHYFSRFVKGLPDEIHFLPYGDSFDFFSKGGAIGNDIFFILSGYFVFASLKRAKSAKEYVVKKFVRIWPPLVIGAVLIFLSFCLFDRVGIFPGSHSFSNMLFSCTMLSPEAVNFVFGTSFGCVNGGFWFLWVIVGFYFISGIVYLINKDKFFRNYTILTCGLACLEIISPYLGYFHLFNEYQTMRDTFQFTNNYHILWMGLLLYMVVNRNLSGAFKYFCYALFLYFYIFDLNWTIKVLVALVAIFILLPKYFKFLEWKPICEVGKASYFLYLIHEPIGVLAIYYLGQNMGNNAWVIAVGMIVLLMLFSIGYSRYVDPFISGRLKRLLLPEKQSQPTE